MKVAVAYEAGQPLVLEDLPVPDIGPRDVLVRVSASGICRTDLHVIEGKSALPLPIVPGHEACGIVEETGPEVRRVRPGDRVLASVAPACGECWWCVNGMSNHCELNAAKAAPRFRLADGRTAGALCGCGTFAEAMVVHEASLVPVQTSLGDDELALLGCGVTTGLARGAQHRRRRPGFQRRGDRLRRRRPVGDPGRPHRRRRGHHRRRPGARTGAMAPVASVPPTRSIRPAETRWRRFVPLPTVAAPTTPSRSSAVPNSWSRPSRWLAPPAA